MLSLQKFSCLNIKIDFEIQVSSKLNEGFIISYHVFQLF